jgi:hypothetical protein
MNDRLNEIEGAIMARLPEDADDFARIKARQVARLQVASERMTDRLAAGRRVDEVKLVRLINTIRRAERELGISPSQGRSCCRGRRSRRGRRGLTAFLTRLVQPR